VAQQVAPTTSRRLFVLAVGVSEHKYPEYNLHFAHRDAHALAEQFRNSAKELFGEVYVQLYENGEADVAHIRDGLDWLARSCSRDDVAVVLFSGHGLRGRNGLYFVPHEGDGQNIQSTCLNWSDTAKRITKTQAAQIFFFADCCHAGAFSSENRPTQDDIVQAVERKDGLLMFCSSQGDQKSVESEDLRQGVFTAAIVEGLQGKADLNGDRSVNSGELVQYVTKRVSAMTDTQQTPHVAFPDAFDPKFEISRLP